MLLALALLIAGCASTRPSPVGERVAYWQSVVDKNIPPGSSVDSVMKWAATRGLKLIFYPDAAQLAGSLEYVPVHDWACKGWSISLASSLSPSGAVQHSTVRTYGNCL